MKFFLLVCIAIYISPTSAEADLDYKGVNYTSWTKGDYPFISSWKPQTGGNAQAISSTRASSQNPYEGSGSLEMSVYLIGNQHSTHSNGETWVDLLYNPPLDTPPNCLIAPLNLFQIPCSAKVYCKEGMEGSSGAWNWLQLFVKDENWRSFYGSPTEINEGVNRWYDLSMIPDTVSPLGGWMDPGFDPTKIVQVGFKVGANDFWDGMFQDTIWLDNFTWPGGSEPKFPFEVVENALDRLENMNANAVSLLVTWYMNEDTSTVIQRDPLKTHTDAEIEATIDTIHNRGMRVMLKPHVDVRNGTWRGAIQPSNIDSWFASYRDSIAVHYAEIAQTHGVELFCIGTEFSTLDNSNTARWTEIIDTIRSICPSCSLTYASNWDAYSSVSFWDRVDLVGIDAYFPLSDQRDPPLDTLLNGWIQWVQEIATWRVSIGKPVLITEIGYSSRDFAASEPWIGCPRADNCSYDYNSELQARCYEAALTSFADSTWFKGFFWWNWFPVSDAGGFCNRDFTPQNKPAEDILKAWYTPTGVSEVIEGIFPIQYSLSQNSPNPFQSQTIIEYQLPQTSELSIKIYNLLGQVVKTLVEKKQQAGTYSISWDGRDEARRQMTSGIYFYRFTTKNFSKTQKIILLQ